MGVFQDFINRAKELQALQESGPQQRNYSQGVDIDHGTGAKSLDSGVASKKQNTENLRTGQDLWIGGEGLNGRRESSKKKGGVGGTRYLGETLGDYANPAYFSNGKISEDYSPLQVTIYSEGNQNREASRVGSMNVYYDKDGAIAGIDLTSDFIIPANGKTYKKGSIRGAQDISNFFKSMELDNENYSADLLSGGGVNFGASYDRYMPTNVFGSKGVLKDPNGRPGKMSTGVFNVQYGAGRGNKDWENYWHNQRVNK